MTGRNRNSSSSGALLNSVTSGAQAFEQLKHAVAGSPDKPAMTLELRSDETGALVLHQRGEKTRAKPKKRRSATSRSQVLGPANSRLNTSHSSTLSA